MAENLLDTCDVCDAFNVSGCASGITFGLGAGHASSTIYYTLTDKFDKEYQGTFATDAAGFGALDLTDFPDDFFNPYAGVMTIEFFTTAYRVTNITGNCTCITMTIIESSATETQYLIC
jgi:hypothetical protein